jgi:hypothetical protein
MHVIVEMQPRGPQPDPASIRQRARAFCRACLEGGRYPTAALLREEFPGAPIKTLQVYRANVLEAAGLTGRGHEVRLDLSRLAQI